MRFGGEEIEGGSGGAFASSKGSNFFLS